MQKQPPEVFCKKCFLRNFAKFTGKHLCKSLFLNKIAGLRQQNRLAGLILRPETCNFIKKETLAQVFS